MTPTSGSQIASGSVPGIGYRRSFAWRFEAMYVWNRSRNTVDEPFTTTDHAIDLTMKRVW